MLYQTDAPYYNYYHLKIVFWGEGNTCHGAYVGGSEARDRESILSFYPGDWGTEFRLSDSVASSLTH